MNTKFFLLLTVLLGVLLSSCRPIQATPARSALTHEGATTMTIAPLTGSLDEKLLLTGHGFAPGAALSVRMGAPHTGLNPTDLATIDANSSGTFQIEVMLPAFWPGSTAPVVEESIVLAVIDPVLNQTLATVTYQLLP